MFAAILLSQFRSYPGITIATDDLITTTDDVITTTYDVIHIICIDLEGKLMCYLFLGQNSPLQISFLDLHMGILMQQSLNNNQKIYCWSKFLYVKNYFIKNGFWLQSLK